MMLWPLFNRGDSAQGLSIILVESLPPFALSLSKGRPDRFSMLTTNGLEEVQPTIERPWILPQPAHLP